ncbi:glycoside hydrolase family 3 protein [Kitasatospora paranensis]|uniref:Glycoside hydrolase family 3 protein n=1 Tax=Kitasatospora paranensis TaxID=258053 RepID=A0ABW2FWF5_9ACTN
MRRPDPELLALADAVLQPGFVGTEAPDWIRRRLADGLGSVLLFARNVRDPEQAAALTGALRAENPHILIAVDEEGGDITRLEAATGSSYPGNLALGAVDDTDLTEAVARSIGAELRAAGIDLDYAPDADVNSNPRNPVIGTRSFGSDAELTARHVAAYVRGLQSSGVAACAKHFPGHGDTDVDSHLGLPRVDLDVAALAAHALPPFRAALTAGARAVMTGHLLVPAYDPDRPATVSERLLQGLLREELGFDGLVVSDAVEMAGVRAHYGLAGATVRALAAGVDLVCIGDGSTEEQVLALREAIADAVADGLLPAERLARAASRVREFGAWSRGLRAAATRTAPDRELGLAAARRAVRVSVHTRGALPLQGPAHLVEFGVPGTVVQGDGVPWGLGPALTGLLPGSTRTTLAADTPHDPAVESEVLRAARGRALVLVVRDAHRRPHLPEWTSALLTRRPDAVVVELGLPRAVPGGAAQVDTHGASRACALAAAEILAGRTATWPGPARPGRVQP